MAAALDARGEDVEDGEEAGSGLGGEWRKGEKVYERKLMLLWKSMEKKNPSKLSNWRSFYGESTTRYFGLGTWTKPKREKKINTTPVLGCNDWSERRGRSSVLSVFAATWQRPAHREFGTIRMLETWSWKLS
jgi:hypothetical protein